MENIYYIGLDVHKRTISYCMKDGSGTILAADAGFMQISMVGSFVETEDLPA